MCFNSSPQAPEVRYVGPSQADIDANNAKLEKYRQDSLTQQKEFASNLQSQIDQANAAADLKRRELEAERTSAAASAAAQQQAAYAVTTTQSEPVAAETTTAVKRKDKTKGTLKIAPGATAMSEGSGINIGV